MNATLIATLSQPFQIARMVDETSSSFRTPMPQTQEPYADAGTATGSAIIPAGNARDTPGVISQNSVQIVPYGVGSPSQTFSMRLIAWNLVPGVPGNGGNQGLLGLWVPTLLIEVSVTLSAIPGIDGSVIDSTHMFPDTITVTTGSTLGGEAAAENIVSPANTVSIGNILVDMRGAQRLELLFATGSSATACNALIKML